MFSIHSLYSSLVQSLLVIVGLILAALLLRFRSVITVEQRPVFGRLVTDFALPALIFISLARHAPLRDELAAVGAMMMSLLICMVLAWLAGRALGLGPKQLGAFILVASFGSSSTLGYALICQVFPGDSAALAEAVIISELGVGILGMTVGMAVAIYFGQMKGSSLTSGLKSFFTTPMFVALVLGLALSFINLPLESPIAVTIFRILDLIGASLTIFVVMAIGLMLRPIPIKSLCSLIVAAALIKLIAKPLIAFTIAEIELLPILETEILLIEAAMPSGTLAAVLADRYGCDGTIASALVVATYGLSLVTIPLIMLLTG